MSDQHQAKRKRIVTDASHNNLYKVAGVGIAWRQGGEAICADVVETPDANVAEALAVLRALNLSKQAGYKHVKIETDCTVLIRTLAKDKPTGDQLFVAVAGQIAMMLLHHPEWKVAKTERKNVRAAHILARQAVKAWVAGAERKSTWGRFSES